MSASSREAPAGVAWRLLRDPSLHRFLVVGGANTALGYVLFRGLLGLYGDRPGAAGLAQATAYAVGIVVAFVLNRRWTFRSSGAVGHEMARFLVAQLGVLAASSLLMELGVGRLHLPVTAWWLAVMVFTTATNFVLQRHWVFARR